MQSYYDELEVSPTASPETIHAAFSSLTQRLSTGAGPVDAERMTRLVTAYRVLSNEQQRAQYEASLRAVGGGPDAPTAAPASPPVAQPLPPNAGTALDEFMAKPIVSLLIRTNIEKFRGSWTIAFAKTRTLAGASNAMSWSWQAFLFGPFYLCYRKMYAYAAAWTAAAFAISLMVFATHTEALSSVYSGLSIFLCLKTKGFYLQHVHSLTQKIETEYPDHASQVAVATAKGGTSWAACIFGGLACLIVASIPDFFGAVQEPGQSQAAATPVIHRTTYSIASLPMLPVPRAAL
jgi:hypothetical protein